MQSFILDRHTDPSNPTMKVTQDDKIPIYDSKADAEADLANIEEGAIVATKDTGATEKVVDVVEDSNMNPVTSNAVYDAIKNLRDKAFKIDIINNSYPMSWTQPDNRVALLCATISDGSYAVYAITTGWCGRVVPVKIAGIAVEISITRSGDTITASSSSGTLVAGVFMTP